ncbi:hypothetical protein AGMMS49938_11000 [Fibrobacterales bacterium]|nr:hypothetical protein AGMMS49938_11000 [Fibrobacterales bacterium]
MTATTKMNIVLIDYENVSNVNLDALVSLDIEKKIFIFTGQDQTKIPISLVQSIQKLGSQVEWIEMQGKGHNALDFHIAYYIGKLSKEMSNIFFHIISKDTGFDPLIATLKKEKILCLREASIEDIPLLKKKEIKTPQQMADLFAERLKQNHPKKKKTLINSIISFFHITEEESIDIVKILQKSGLFSLNEEKVEYNSTL